MRSAPARSLVAALLHALSSSWILGCGGIEQQPPSDLGSAPLVIITVRNSSEFVLALPSLNPAPATGAGWLTIDGHESWLYFPKAATAGYCEDVTVRETGDWPPPGAPLTGGGSIAYFPPPGATLAKNQSFVYSWKTNGFGDLGTKEQITGPATCVHFVRVPQGHYQARICAKLDVVMCSVQPMESDAGPVCHTVPIDVANHDTAVETTFASDDFPNDLCQADKNLTDGGLPDGS
jgi:hypothetical protein